jgi:hypothetical protein
MFCFFFFFIYNQQAAQVNKLVRRLWGITSWRQFDRVKIIIMQQIHTWCSLLKETTWLQFQISWGPLYGSFVPFHAIRHQILLNKLPHRMPRTLRLSSAAIPPPIEWLDQIITTFFLANVQNMRLWGNDINERRVDASSIAIITKH